MKVIKQGFFCIQKANIEKSRLDWKKFQVSSSRTGFFLLFDEGKGNQLPEAFVERSISGTHGGVIKWCCFNIA